MTDNAVPLRAQTLASLADVLPVPTYDRSKVGTGIVHIGVGAFHRAHQAFYLDQLLEKGSAPEWGLCGVGVLESDSRIRDALREQDCLYTLVEKAPDGTWSPRVVGSIVRYLLAPDDPKAVLERMVDPNTRIVSMTVTEGGYSVNQVTGEFDPSPQVAADAHERENPRTTFGLVVEALARRRAAGIGPFTVMSCDNVQGNGHVAGKVFSAFARLRDPDLANWIEGEVRFPNSMVDRITPATTDDDRREISERFGIRDAWPVVCEPFLQWVLEDSFNAGRPALEEVGVQVVDDVVPYELMKLRLLNAGHQALAYFGHLLGYRLVHEAAQDRMLADFVRAYMDREATPTLAPVPGVDLEDYKRQLIERFSNPGVRDTVARLALEASDRIPKFVLPAVRANLEAGRPVPLGAAIVATWARYAEGVDEQGEPIKVVDRLTDELVPLAQRQRQEPLAFLSREDLFGNLVNDPRFTEPYLKTLESLHRRGARATLTDLLTE